MRGLETGCQAQDEVMELEEMSYEKLDGAAITS